MANGFPDKNELLSLSDERTRLEDAEIKGVLYVVRSLLNKGMNLSTVAKYTDYDVEELKHLLKKYSN